LDDEAKYHRQKGQPDDFLSLVSARRGEQPGDRKSDQRADGELTVLDQKADQRRPNALKHFALRSARPPEELFSGSAPRASSRRRMRRRSAGSRARRRAMS